MTITVAEPYLKIGRLNSHVTRVPEEDKKPKKYENREKIFLQVHIHHLFSFFPKFIHKL